MKRIFTFAIALMSMFVVLQNASALVYNVTVPAGTEACFISGSMNSWSSPLVNRMTKVDETHFTLDIPTALETDSFKYYCGPDWKYEERDASGVALAKNRGWHASDVVANWNALYLTSYEKDITIDVLTPSTTIQCYIVGSFNNWASPSTETQLTKVGTSVDGVEFSKTIHVLDTTTVEFKFVAGPAWAYEQTNPTANFKYFVDGGVVVVNAFKAIYDPEKTGTINITATVPVGTDNVWIMGDFLGWNMANAVQATKNPDGTFSFSIPMVMTIEYRLYNKADWAYPEVGEADPTKELANRSAIYPGDANTNITVWGWKQSTNAVKQINADNYKIYSVNKSFVVEGVTSQVDVIDISGRMLQSEKMTGKFTSKNLNTGLYILRVDGATKKVSLR